MLHTLEVEDVADVLDRLRASDLPNLFLPRKDDFVRVDEIPLLGSGKTDPKAVKETAAVRTRGGWGMG